MDTVQQTSAVQQPQEVGGWTVGLAVFAGAMMLIGGVFQAFEGLAAILNSEFFVVGTNYIYDIDITAWGWWHLILGTVLAFAGVAVFSGKGWGRVIGIIIATLSAIANFFFIPYYPFWSLLIIALDIAIIAALAAYGTQEAKEVGAV